ncbi:MAG: hypothetical protein HRT72_00075 [Flavobacteriales bacterium]|nr:hypothetical protein [Flavobacteriales bacterium]
MNTKRDLIIYRVITGLFTAHTIFNSVMYFAMYSMVVDMFTHLGAPTEIIYPMAIIKLSGIGVI